MMESVEGEQVRGELGEDKHVRGESVGVEMEGALHP